MTVPTPATPSASDRPPVATGLDAAASSSPTCSPDGSTRPWSWTWPYARSSRRPARTRAAAPPSSSASPPRTSTGYENWNRVLVEHASENGSTLVRVAAAVSAAHGEDVLRSGYRAPADLQRPAPEPRLRTRRRRVLRRERIEGRADTSGRVADHRSQLTRAPSLRRGRPSARRPAQAQKPAHHAAHPPPPHMAPAPTPSDSDSPRRGHPHRTPPLRVPPAHDLQ